VDRSRDKWGRTRGALFCLLLFAAPCFCAQKPPVPRAQEGTPVLLITIDTLRADHLQCYGYRRVQTPAINELAAQGVRFANAFTEVPITFPSHTVILTGTYPMWNGARDFTSPPLSPRVGLLAQAFERHGYRTAAFVSAFVLDSSWGLARGFQTYDDRFAPQQYQTRNPGNIERPADVTVDHVLAWLKEGDFGRPGARPFFVWVHLYDPHSPYDPPEPFRSRYAGHPYDGEIAYADSQLGRLFDFLRRAGLYDRSLIVLLADHGESLGEHGEREHGFFIYDATLHIPLIVKPPRGEAPPHVVSAPVGEIDVAPTVLDLAGIHDPLRRQFQGSSLASVVLGKGAAPARRIYAETYYPRDSFGWSPLRSITTARYHYIQAPRPELYAWPADPGETHNLYAQHQALSAALRGELQEIEQRFTPHKALNASGGPPLSPATVEKLKSLGYIAYSAPAAPAASGALPDPKDRLKVYQAILRAEDLSAAGRLDESNQILQALTAQEPHLYLIPFMQAENAAHARQWSSAEQHFLACLKLNPSFDQAIIGLARAYLNEGRGDAARPWLELAVHQNPHNFLAFYALGLTAREQGRNQEAYEEFTRSVKEKPDFPLAQEQLGILLVEMKRYAEAVGPLSKAAQLDPQNAVVANFLGTSYANSSQPSRAVEAYRQALSLKPDYTAARLNLAFAYLKAGDRSKARQEFQTLCRQDESLCQRYQSVFQ
jgi:choline-sulfatase